jgi:flagellar protein FlgJ
MAAIGATAPQTATDFAALAQLRARAGRDGSGVTPEVARQFEAIFVQMMLKSMRDAGAAFGDGSDTTYRDLFDQQIAMELTRGKGLGLAALITQQLGAPAMAPDELAVRAPDAGDTVAARVAPLPTAPQPGLSAPALSLQDLPPPEFAIDTAPAQSTPAAGDSWRDWRPATPEEFVRDVWPLARDAGQKLGVDPRAIIAQAALETGWGRRVARTEGGLSANNLFNIKADTRWQGPRVTVPTLEFENGLPRPQRAAFRAYPDLQTAFADYVQFMQGNPRYTEALRHGAEGGRFAESLQAAGYATDPDYATKLRSILGGERLNGLIAPLKNLLPVPTL